MEALSASTGIGEPVLRLLTGLLLCYPFSTVYKVLPDSIESLKHLYCALCGIFLAQFCYKWDIIHSFLSILLTYLVLWAFKSHRTIGLAIAFFGNMGHLLGSYWIFASVDSYDVDFTTAQCVLTLRLIGFAWDYFDGSKDPKELEHDQKENNLSELPPLLHFFGYTYFYGSFLTGPQFTFRMYKKFITKENFMAKKVDGHIPSSVGPALQKFFLGVLYLGLQNAGAMFYTPSIYSTTRFVNMGLLEKVVTTVLVGKIFIMKYIGVWLIAEGACILCGLGFGGWEKDGKPKWDAVSNVKPWALETATSLQNLVDSFNINTNDWVKRYVFKRLRFLNNRNLSALGALWFLALWHGFSIGYYITFGLEFASMEAEKKLRKYGIILYPKLPAPLQWLYSLLCHVVISITLYYCLSSFELKTWALSLPYFSAMHWLCHVGLLVVFVADPIFSMFLPKSRDSPSASPSTTKKRE